MRGDSSSCKLHNSKPVSSILLPCKLHVRKFLSGKLHEKILLHCKQKDGKLVPYKLHDIKLLSFTLHNTKLVLCKLHDKKLLSFKLYDTNCYVANCMLGNGYIANYKMRILCILVIDGTLLKNVAKLCLWSFN